MKITNKSLRESVKKNLREMPMDLPPENEPHPDVTDKLSQGNTPFDKVEFPEPEAEGPESNFQELLASERYRDVIQKVSEYLGRPISLKAERGLMPLMRTAGESLQRIIQTERAHREELENLAIELVTKEMGIQEGDFQFDAKIVGIGEMDMGGMNRDEEQPEQPEQPEGGDEEMNLNNEVEIAGELEHLNLEKAKRRLINSIIQGSAMKGYYMYHYAADRIAQITGSDDLIRNYGIMMSVNDSLYWQLPDQSLDMAMGGGGQSMAGKEEVDRNTDPPTIIARGVTFPVLVHELIKGVMELLAIHGEPEVGGIEVGMSEDTLEKEIWDIRLGPSIWNRIRAQFPEEILLDENQRHLQNFLLVAIFKLKAKDFLVFVKEILSGTPRGKSMMAHLMNGVKASFNEENEPDVTELHTEIEEAAEETDDNELNDFLQNLGIKSSKEPEGNIPQAQAPQGGQVDDKKLASMGLNQLNYEMNKAIDDENWELAQKIQQMIDRKQGNRG